MRSLFILALTAAFALQQGLALPMVTEEEPTHQQEVALPPPPTEGQTAPASDKLGKLDADVLSRITSYLTRSDTDAAVESSDLIKDKMKEVYRYDPELSVLGSPGNYAQGLHPPAPPAGIDYYYLYVCDNTLDALEAAKSSRVSKGLKTLHVKLCRDDYQGNIDRLVIDKFLALTDKYAKHADLTELKVFGPGGEPLAKHLYDYLDVNPNDYEILDQLMATNHFDINEKSIDGHTMLSLIHI